MTSEFPEHPAHAIVSGLLDYAIVSNPFPLQASAPAGEATIARLDMVVSAPPGDPVTCSRMEIHLPIGDSAQSLVSTADGITTTPPTGWTGTVTSTATATATVTFTPPGNSFVFDQDGVVASIGGLRINKEPGNAEVRITEHPVAVKSPIVLVLAKHPHRPPVPAGSPNRFSARRWADDTLNPSPATEVTAGQKVTLTWQHRPDVERYLFTQPLNSDLAATGHDVTQATRWDSAPLLRPTTFTLRTKVVEAGKTTYEYDTVTVTVDTPTYAELSSSGPIRAGASGTVAFLDAVAVPGSLTVDGAITARGGLTSEQTFTTEDRLTAPQGITVQGPASAAANSSVPGGEVTSAGIITKDLTAKKTVKIFGSITNSRTLGNIEPVGRGRTDTLVLGYLKPGTAGAHQRATLKVADRQVGCGSSNVRPASAVFLPLRKGEQATVEVSPGTATNPDASKIFVATFGTSPI
ncbi:hypothetical protein [Embleya sp. NPDC005971]|uniref:hypothetical protein n=1 Tax=Embleya sp. NPDC005971 TaxID=3156724 RepID=UPI0033DFAF02